MHSRELDETNRGVVALYAELDEGTKALQRLSDLKSRFLSEMSHELRSPLNSIKGLTGFLLARSDGDLTAEQEKQVHSSARPPRASRRWSTTCSISPRSRPEKPWSGPARSRSMSLFEGLQGTIRPMIDHERVSLIFEEPIGIPTLDTDEGKVAQILRNFLTNAVKFTERGEIRVECPAGTRATWSFSRSRIAGSGSRAEDLTESSRNMARSKTPCKGGRRALAWGCH